MKKLLPILIALLLMLGLMPVGAFAAEEYSDTIYFNNSTTATSENGLFTLTADTVQSAGWPVGNTSSTKKVTLTINANQDGLTITRLVAAFGDLGDGFYSVVGVSGSAQKGEILEDGIWKASVTDINASEFSFSILGSQGLTFFKDITVYYSEPEPEPVHVHNYQLKTSYVCADCGEEAPVGYVPDGNTASTLSEGNITILCTVAAAVVFGLGGFILGTKKKKPALANGGNSEDEE